MKRAAEILMLITMLVALLVACGGEEAPEATQSPTVEAPVVPTAESDVAAEATLPPPVVEQEGQPENGATEEQEPTAETETATGPVFPWPEDRFGYGIQIHGNAAVGDPKATMDAVSNQLGLDWVKIQLQWAWVHPSPDAGQWFFYDGVIDEAYNDGLNVMLSIVGAPEWTRAAGGENGPPDDYGQFAAFVDEVLTRYEGKVQAIEVWNEQNLDREWATPEGLSPEAYVEFLRIASERIKAHNPNIIVISGALSPTGVHDRVTSFDDFVYLDEMLAAGLLDYADCVGVHHNGYNVPPDAGVDALLSLPEAETAQFRGPFSPPFDEAGNPHHSWSFKTTLDTYAAKVQAVSPDKKLCVTEFGWASSEGYDQAPTGFGFALDNTLEEQATYIVQAFQQMHDSGNVWLAFLFNFDFGNKGSGPEDDTVPYSIIDINGAPRPAYGALAEMEKVP